MHLFIWYVVSFWCHMILKKSFLYAHIYAYVSGAQETFLFIFNVKKVVLLFVKI